MAAAALIPIEQPGLGELASAAARAQEYARQARAPNTLRAYANDWHHFEQWCTGRGLRALPATPQTVALYLSDLAETHKASTIQRRVSAISQAHQMSHYAPPTQAPEVRAVMAGIRRAKGTAPNCKTPVLVPDLRQMLSAVPAGLLGVRDRGLLLLGFAGAFRRSELVSLNIEDLDFRTEGLVITLRRSKTDQDAEGRKVGIPYGSNPATCPVRSLRAWIEASGTNSRPLFRSVDRHGRVQPGRLSDKAVALVVKRYAAAAGKDAAEFAGHSLRAGLATSAAIAGASERSIMAQTGHRSVNMVRRYIRDGSLFRENAAAQVGL